MAELFRSVLLEKNGKINEPLSYSHLTGAKDLKKVTVTVSSPGTPETAISTSATVVTFMYDNEDSSAHYFDIYDGTTKIYRINCAAGTSDVINQIKVPITTSLRIDSDSSLPILTAIYY